MKDFTYQMWISLGSPSIISLTNFIANFIILVKLIKSILKHRNEKSEQGYRIEYLEKYLNKRVDDLKDRVESNNG